MKHKALLISTISVGVTFILILVSSLIIGNSLNLEDEMTKLIEFNNENEDLRNYLQGIANQNKISNIFQFATFSFWIEGAITNYSIHSFKTASFILIWGFVFPIILIIFSILIVTYIILVFNERIRREYKYKILKSVGKWGMYSSVICLILFTTIFIILISVLERQFFTLGVENQVINSLSGDNIDYSDRILLGTIVTMIFNGIGNVDKNIVDPNIVDINLLITTLVFLSVFIMSSTITTIVFSSIWIATFISQRNNSLSKFTRWLANVRIDSHREFREILLKNVCFWVLLSLLVITLIYPGLVHRYDNISQIIISIVTICLFPIALSPTFIALIRISKIRMFNYNLMMFLQIIILSVVVSSLQLVIWLLFGNQIIGLIWLKFAMPFYTTMTSIISSFGFIKWRT